MIILSASVLLGACDWPWPRENPADQRRCDPACAAGERCFEGRCVGSDAALPDAAAPEAGTPDGLPPDASEVPDGPGDGAMAGDLPDDQGPPPDSKVSPDSVKWGCTLDKDCDDKLSCTLDTCLASKTCQNALATGNCLIGGVCVAEGAALPSNTCLECATKVSASGYTAVSGKPCGGVLANKMCIGSQCRGFAETTYVTSGNNQNSAFSGVARAPSGTTYWAVGFGGEGASMTKGFIYPLGGNPAQVVSTGKPLSAIHHGLAVGQGGTAYLSTGATWTKVSLPLSSSSSEIWTVWGHGVASSSTYYIGRTQASTVPSISACMYSGSGTGFSCTGHSGISQGIIIGRIFGIAPTGGSPGSIWALSMGSGAPDHVYYQPLSSPASTSWSSASPTGCHDSGSPGPTPCSGYSGEFRDIGGSGPANMWVAGTSGFLMRYDGKAWSAVTAAFSNQSSFSLSAVYSSDTDKLTTIAATDNLLATARVCLFNYNHLLNRWLGPVNLSLGTTYQAPDHIDGIAGEGYKTLWLVGRKSILGQVRAWALELK